MTALTNRFGETCVVGVPVTQAPSSGLLRRDRRHGLSSRHRMAGFGSSDHLLALRHTASRTLDRTRVSSKFTKSMCARPDTGPVDRATRRTPIQESFALADRLAVDFGPRVASVPPWARVVRPSASHARARAPAPSEPPALVPPVNTDSVLPWTPSSREMEPPENPVRFSLPSEERCHSVAKTRVDSGGLRETGGDNRMAGT